MKFKFNDGGREAAGYKGKASDCVTRAIAIATGKPYQEVYDAINECAVGERTGDFNELQHPEPGTCAVAIELTGVDSDSGTAKRNFTVAGYDLLDFIGEGRKAKFIEELERMDGVEYFKKMEEKL